MDLGLPRTSRSLLADVNGQQHQICQGGVHTWLSPFPSYHTITKCISYFQNQDFITFQRDQNSQIFGQGLRTILKCFYSFWTKIFSLYQCVRGPLMAVSAQNEGGLEDGGGSHVLYVLCSVILTTPELSSC